MGSMAVARLFRNGNSQAARIPAELAYGLSVLELEIERVGDELRIRPAEQPIRRALAALASFSTGLMAEDRGNQEQAERGGL